MKKSILIICMIIVVFLTSCAEFLDVKPDRVMSTPSSLADIQAMLDNVNYMNTSYTPLGEVSSDTYYLLPAVWSALPTVEQRNEYLLNRQPVSSLHWAVPYRAVFTANTAMDALDKIDSQDRFLRNQLEGTALFHRGRYFLNLAEVFCKTYNEEHLQEPGIVLKLNPDINEKSVRSTVEETYNQILKDLRKAADLLSTEKAPYPTRPTKQVAYAVLAQTYLIMKDYDNALRYADSCLRGVGEIAVEDFRLLPVIAGNPFKRHGKEVLFYSRFTSVTLLTTSRANIDTALLSFYDDADLRKTHYFSRNTNGTYAFKGDYSLNTSATYFNGITIPEILLIRAECFARQGNLQEARDDLKILVDNRYKSGEVPDLSAFSTQKELLRFILDERRRELIFRGVRWSDLRRLSDDPDFATGIERWVNGEKYGLDPTEIYRYAHMLPDAIIDNSTLQQN